MSKRCKQYKEQKRKSLWKLILMLAACVSRQHEVRYTQIATFTTDELYSKVFAGTMGESEQKIGGAT